MGLPLFRPDEDPGPSFFGLLARSGPGLSEALSAAREDWKKARASGHAASYWQQDEAGRWGKKA